MLTELTPEQRVEGAIRAARDSAWVVTDELAKLASGQPWTPERRGNIERNVAHLELVIANPDVANSGQDISDLTNAINAGKAELAARAE